MTATVTFRDLIMRLAPRWLKGPNASRFLYSLGIINDAATVLETEGFRAGLPGLCNDDALPYLGRDRVITRGFAEPSDLYAARLTNFLDAHQVRGGNYELLEQIRQWWSPLFRSVTLVTNNSQWYAMDASGNVTYTKSDNWNWDAASWDGSSPRPDGAPPAKWWRFWIIVDGSPFFKWKWGDGHHFGDPDLVWGTTAPKWFVNGLRQIVATWKTQDAVCDRIIFKYDDSLFLPSNATGSPGMPDGTWDVAANRATAATYLQGVN